jgi:uncharacterized RDD family membrane protein YckC
LAAWLIDLVWIGGWVTVLAAVGATLYATGVVRELSVAAGNVVSFLVLVAPVTLALAWFESGPRQATVGKRIRRLRVVDAGTQSTIPFRRALLRNVVKLTVPWELGHVAVYGLVAATGGPPGWLMVVAVAANVVPAVYVATLFVAGGRTPADWLARTVVAAN